MRWRSMLWCVGLLACVCSQAQANGLSLSPAGPALSAPFVLMSPSLTWDAPLGSDELGVLRQSTVDPGPFYFLVYAAPILGVVAMAVALIGNLYALITGKGELGWGIAGVAVGVLAAVIGIALLAPSLAVGLAVLLSGLAISTMGVANIVRWNARRRQRFSSLDSAPASPLGRNFAAIHTSGLAIEF